MWINSFILITQLQLLARAQVSQRVSELVITFCGGYNSSVNLDPLDEEMSRRFVGEENILEQVCS
jgi:hypothetical protein